jgi:serine/threonine-protein phosphatase 5
MPAPEEAVALKEKGNAAVKAKDWPTALEFYTKAIDLHDQEASFYSNRAQVGSQFCGFLPFCL